MRTPAGHRRNGQWYLRLLAVLLSFAVLAAPAAMFLDSMGPMSFLGSQALHLLTPVIECALEGKDIERVARLLERRDTITRLVALIESKTSPKRASAAARTG